MLGLELRGRVLWVLEGLGLGLAVLELTTGSDAGFPRREVVNSCVDAIEGGLEVVDELRPSMHVVLVVLARAEVVVDFADFLADQHEADDLVCGGEVQEHMVTVGFSHESRDDALSVCLREAQGFAEEPELLVVEFVVHSGRHQDRDVLSDIRHHLVSSL